MGRTEGTKEYRCKAVRCVHGRISRHSINASSFRKKAARSTGLNPGETLLRWLGYVFDRSVNEGS